MKKKLLALSLIFILLLTGCGEHLRRAHRPHRIPPRPCCPGRQVCIHKGRIGMHGRPVPHNRGVKKSHGLGHTRQMGYGQGQGHRGR